MAEQAEPNPSLYEGVCYVMTAMSFYVSAPQTETVTLVYRMSSEGKYAVKPLHLME